LEQNKKRTEEVSYQKHLSKKRLETSPIGNICFASKFEQSLGLIWGNDERIFYGLTKIEGNI